MLRKSEAAGVRNDKYKIHYRSLTGPFQNNYIVKDWNKDDVAELRPGAAGFEGDFAGRLTASVAAVIKEVSRIKSRLESFLWSIGFPFKIMINEIIHSLRP